jgi:ubiquinone/menaquinone biosynthesis C-methylase UbiE
VSEPPREARLEKFYDRVAPIYGIWAKLFESQASRRAYELARLAVGESVLEVATGAGEFYSFLLGTKGLGRCVGVDRSFRMLARARGRMLRSGNAHGSLCRADARRLPFGEAAFDVLFNFYMVDLFPESEIVTCLEEFGRVLRPSGRLVLLAMGAQARILNTFWMWLYGRAPLLVGGCRPVPAARALGTSGWRIEVQEQISQWGFRSDLIVARVPPRT